MATHNPLKDALEEQGLVETAPQPAATEAELLGDAFSAVLKARTLAESRNRAERTTSPILPLGTRSSSLDSQMTDPSWREDLGEFRGLHQSSLDKIGNGLVKLVPSTAGNIVGTMAGTVYGLGRVIGKGELSAMYTDNVVFDAVDGMNRIMNEKFPHYYTRREQELSWGSLGTMNFWSDQFLNGMSFLAGAVLSELAITALTGGMGSVPGAAMLGARASKVLNVGKAASRLKNMGRASTVGAATDAAAAIGGGASLAETGLMVGKTARQLLTGAGFEASIESMHLYDSMSEKLMDERFGDRWRAAQEQGVVLSREDKRKLLTAEEQKRIHEDVKDATDLSFGLNVGLVGLSNMVGLGKWFRPKLPAGMFRTASRYPKSGMDDLMRKHLKLSDTGIRNTRVATSVIGKGGMEAFEEIAQGTLSRWGDSYAMDLAYADGNTQGVLSSLTDYVLENANPLDASPEAVREGLLGGIIGMIGLPWAGTSTISQSIQEANDHMAKMNLSKEREKQVRKWIEDLSKTDPSVLNSTRQAAHLINAMANRAPKMAKAEAEGDTFNLKNLETDNLVDYIMYKMETGDLDGLKKELTDTEALSDEEFRKEFMPDPAITEEQLLTRRTELAKKSRELVKGVEEAMKTVDDILRLSADERFLNMSSPTSKAFQRKLLIQSLVSAKDTEARENKLLEEIKELTGGRISEVLDEVDTLNLSDDQGDLPIRIGNMSTGDTVGKMLQDTQTRLAMLESIPANNRKASIQREIETLSALVGKLSAMNRDELSPDLLRELDNSGELLTVDKWAQMDPIRSAGKTDALKQKLRDVRALRQRRQKALETWQVMLDPEMRKAWQANFLKALKAAAEAAKANMEKKEEPEKKDANKEKREKAKKVAEMRKRLRSYEFLLSEQLKEAKDHIEVGEAFMQEAIRDLEVLKKAVVRALKKTGKQKVQVTLSWGRVRVTADRVQELVEKAKENEAAARKFLEEAKAEKEPLIAELREMITVVNAMIQEDPKVVEQLVNEAIETLDVEFREKNTWLQDPFVDELDGQPTLFRVKGERTAAEIFEKAEETLIAGFEEEAESLRQRIEGLSEIIGYIERLAGNLANIKEMGPAAGRLAGEFELAANPELYNELFALLETEEGRAQLLGWDADPATGKKAYRGELRLAKAKMAKQLDDIEKEIQRRRELSVKTGLPTGYVAMKFAELAFTLKDFDPLPMDDGTIPSEVLEAEKESGDLWVPEVENIHKTIVKLGTHEELEGKGALNIIGDHTIGEEHEEARHMSTMSEEEKKEYLNARAQVEFNHFLGSNIETDKNGTVRKIDILNSSYSETSKKVYGNVLLAVHRNNLADLPEEIKNEIGPTLYDDTDIKLVLVKVESPDGPGSRYWTEHRNEFGRLIMASMVTESLTRKDGSSRYRIAPGQEAEAEKLSAEHAKLRAGILGSKAPRMFAINGKFSGQLIDGGIEIKASEAVMHASYLHNVKLEVVTREEMPADTEESSAEPKEEIPETKVGKRKFKYGKMYAAPAEKRRKVKALQFNKVRFKAGLGKVVAYDHVRQVAVPMTRVQHTPETALNVMCLSALLLQRYQELLNETGKPTEAKDRVKLMTVKAGDREVNVYNLIEDLVQTISGDSDYHFHINFGYTPSITFGKEKELVLPEDIKLYSPAASRLEAFLQTKFQQVNKSRLEDDVKDTGYLKDLKKGERRSATGRYGLNTKENREWTYVKVGTDLKVSHSETFRSYSEYLLKGLKEAEKAPLMSMRRPYKATREKPRTMGGYLTVRPFDGKELAAENAAEVQYKKEAPTAQKAPAKPKAAEPKQSGPKDARSPKEPTPPSQEPSEEVLESLIPAKGKVVNGKFVREDSPASTEAPKSADTGDAFANMASTAPTTADWTKLLAKHREPDGSGLKVLVTGIGLDKKPRLSKIEIRPDQLVTREVEPGKTVTYFDNSPIVTSVGGDVSTEDALTQMDSSDAFWAAISEAHGLTESNEPEEGDSPFMLWQGETVPTDRQAEYARANQMTDLEVTEVDGLLQSMDGPASAQLVAAGKVLLGTLADPGALYHEAFHDVELYILSPEDRALLYDKVREQEGEHLTFRGELKAFRDMSDQEASEWLAEELRKTVLDPNRKVGAETISKENMIQRFLRLVKNLLRRLFNLDRNFQYRPGSSSVEDVLADIRSGHFKGAKRNGASEIMRPYMRKMTANGMSVTDSRAMVRIFKRLLGDLQHLGSTKDGTRHEVSMQELLKLLSHSKKYPTEMVYLKRELDWLLRKEMSPKVRELYATDETKRDLMELTISNLLELVGSEEYLRSLMEEENELEEKVLENWDKGDNEESQASKVPEVVKLLLSTLPGETNHLGMQEAADLSTVLHVLQGRLSGTMGFDNQLIKLKELAEENRYPWAQKLYDRLRDTHGLSLAAENERPGRNVEEVMLRTAFSKHMSGMTTAPALAKINEKGNVYVQDPVTENELAKLQRRSKSSLLSKGRKFGYIRLSGKRLVAAPDVPFAWRGEEWGKDSLKGILSRVGRASSFTSDGLDTLIQAASLLGVEFTAPARLKDYLLNEADERTAKDFQENVFSILSEVVSNPSNVTLFDRNVSASVTRFRELLRLELQTSQKPRELVLRNSENKLEFALTRPNMLGILTGYSWQEMAYMFNPRKNPWATNSIAVEHFKRGGTFKVVPVMGLQPDERGEPGKKLAKLSPTDLAVTFMANLFNGTMLSARAADQGTEMAFEMRDSSGTLIDPLDGMFDKGKLDTSKFAELLEGYLASEIAAVATFSDKAFIADFDAKGEELRFFKGLLPADEQDEILKYAKDHEKEIRDGLKKNDLSKVQSFIHQRGYADLAVEELRRQSTELGEELYRLGVFYNRKEGVSYNRFASAKVLRQIKEQGIKDPDPETLNVLGDEQRDEMLFQLVARDTVANIEFFKLFAGDPALYKAIFKRTKIMMGGRDATDMSRDLVEVVQRTASHRIHLGDDGNGNLVMARGLLVDEATFKAAGIHAAQLVEELNLLKANTEKDTSVSKAYLESSNYADGTIVSLPEVMRFTGILQGNWSPEEEEAYQSLGDPDAVFRKGGTIIPKKTVYAGPVQYKEDQSVTSTGMDKMSVNPIFKELGLINEVEYPNIQRLINLMRQPSKKEPYAFLILPSAQKVGGLKESMRKPLIDGDGNVNSDHLNEATIWLDLRFYGEQTKVSPFFKEKVGMFTQARTLVLADLFEEGVLSPQADTSPEEAQKMAELVAEYNTLINMLTEDSAMQVISKWGLENVADTQGNTRLRLVNRNRFLKELKDLPIKKELGAPAEQAIESFIDRQNSLPDSDMSPLWLDSLPEYPRIESMLMRSINKAINSPKVKGEMYVLTSELGYEKQKVNGVETDHNLRFYLEPKLDEEGQPVLNQETGKPELNMSMEVFVSSTINDLHGISELVIKEVKGSKRLFGYSKKAGLVEIGNADVILNMIGIRIPTDGIHSIEKIVIKGFLPTVAGPRIVVPKLLVVKAGSDFDIDKLNTYLKEFGVTLNKEQRTGTAKPEIFYRQEEHAFEANQKKLRKKIEDLRTRVMRPMEKAAEFIDASVNEGMSLLMSLLKSQISSIEDLTPEEEAEFEAAMNGAEIAAMTQEERDNAFAEAILKNPKYSEFYHPTGEPKTFEEWKAENPDANVWSMNTPKARHNRLIDVMDELLGLSERTISFMTPVGVRSLQDEGDAIERIFAARGSNAIPDLDSRKDIQTSMRLLNRLRITLAYMRAKRTVGIFALHVTHHTKATMAGLALNPQGTVEVSNGKYNPVLAFKGMAEEYSMSKRRNREGVAIGELLSQLVNAATDMVNTPVLHKLNISTDTAPVWAYMVRRGVPLKTISLFMNQTVVRELIEVRMREMSYTVRQTTGGLRHDEITLLLEKKYAPSSERVIAELSDEDMQRCLAYTTETVPEEDREIFMQVQTLALRQYLIHKEASDTLSSIMNGQSYDTKAPKSRGEAVLKRRMYANAMGKNVFLNAEKILTGTLESSFLHSFEMYQGLTMDMFRQFHHSDSDPSFNLVWESLIRTLSDDRNGALTDDAVAAAERLDLLFTSWVGQQMPYSSDLGTRSVVESERERLLYSKDNIAVRVENALTKGPLKDNLWLNSVMPVINEAVSSNSITIPQNKVSGVLSYGSTVTASAKVRALLGPKPTSMDMVVAGLRTRTSRSASEVEKMKLRIGSVVSMGGKLSDGTTSTVTVRITAVHPKGSPGWKGTWEKEGWEQKDIHVLDRYLDGAEAYEFEIVSDPATRPKSGNSYLEPQFKRPTDFELREMMTAFEEIVTTDPKLAEDLYRTAMLQTGLIQTPTKFLQYLPGDFVEKRLWSAWESYERQRAAGKTLSSGELLNLLVASSYTNSALVANKVGKANQKAYAGKVEWTKEKGSEKGRGKGTWEAKVQVNIRLNDPTFATDPELPSAKHEDVTGNLSTWSELYTTGIELAEGEEEQNEC